MSENVMIDLETGATTPNAVVFAVGLVVFNDHKVEPIEELRDRAIVMYPEIGPQNILPRILATETLAWHAKEPNRAEMLSKYLDENSAITVDQVFDKFEDTIKPKAKVWANSPSFDLAILRHWAKQVGRELPFKFYQELDFRTLKHLAREYGIQLPKADEELAHTADYDAAFQAHCTQHILCSLKADS